MSKKYTMHLISGTHWDREWRHTSGQSRLRLTDLVDHAMDVLESGPDYKSFCLDGGMIVVEDYLAARPENRDRLIKLVKEGRIMLTGLYTLPDTFIVAPEALIRNFLIGHSMAHEYGGPIKSGYSSFSYGQTSQFPQIHQGFGLDTAMFYRGTNQFEVPPLFCWEGKDGSQLRTIRTFDDVTRTNWFFGPHYRLVLGKDFRDARYHYNREEQPSHFCDETLYERAYHKLNDLFDFKKDPESLKAAVDAIRSQAMPHAIGNHLLALNLQDNAWCFELMPDMVKAMNSVADDMEIVQNTFDEYFDTILEENKDEELFVHKGELRFTGVAPGLTGLYGASQSSRIKLKLLNDHAETWLTRIAEPLASMASMYGEEYPATVITGAWRSLLKNHAHDSICGAAVDQAHEDMVYRFSEAAQIGEEVAARSMESIFTRIDTKTTFEDGDFTITLFNTMPWARSEVVPLVVDLPSIDDEASPTDPCTGLARYDKELKLFELVDSAGEQVDFEIVDRDLLWLGVESRLDSHSIELRTVRWRLLVHAGIPAMGYTTLALRKREPEYIEHPKPAADRQLIARPDGVLENEHIKVEIKPNGTFKLLHKDTVQVFDNLHYFTDSGETGSAHRSNQPLNNTVVTSLGCPADITMLESSELRGIYEIKLNMRVPERAELDASGRSRELIDLPIEMRLTVEKDCPYLKIRTRVDNSARDHKLQLNLPTCLRTDEVSVESAFAVDQRDLRWMDTADNSEARFMLQPMQNFVDMTDGEAGLAFLSGGLREYETNDDADRTLSITLLRTQRAYMKASAKMRPDELEKYTGLHSFGPHEYNYALCPHSGNWLAGNVLQNAYNIKAGIKALLGVPSDGDLPATASLLSLEPCDKLAVSALKQSEDGSGIVLRVWNTTGENLNAIMAVGLPAASATRLRLDETVIEDLDLKDGKLALPIGPYKIETILLSR